MSETEVYLKRQIDDLRRELDRLKTNIPEFSYMWHEKVTNITKDASMICHYDGQEPYNTDFTGNPTGHMGQVAAVSGGVIYRPGKFGKAVQVAEATTNLVNNPVMRTLWYGWGTPSVRELSTKYVKFDLYSLHLIGDSLGDGAYFTLGANLTSGVTYTLSGHVTVISGTGSLLVFKTSSPYTVYREVTFTESGYYSVTFTMPENAACYVKCSSNGEFYFDGVQLEQKAYPTPLCYGDMPGHSWSGTAHASTSTRTTANLIYSAKCAPPGRSMTVLAWVEPAVVTGGINYFAIAGTTPLDWTTGWSLAIAGGTARVNLRDPVVNITGGTILSNKKYFIAFTYDGSMLRLYVDGVKVNSAAATHDVTNNLPLYVGNAASARPFNGTIDDLAIFSRALTADEIKAIYESDAPIPHFNSLLNGIVYLQDGVSTPVVGLNAAIMYIDSADGDLKIKFADGTVKTIVVDT